MTRSGSAEPALPEAEQHPTLTLDVLRRLVGTGWSRLRGMPEDEVLRELFSDVSDDVVALVLSRSADAPIPGGC